MIKAERVDIIFCLFFLQELNENLHRNIKRMGARSSPCFTPIEFTIESFFYPNFVSIMKFL